MEIKVLIGDLNQDFPLLFKLFLIKLLKMNNKLSKTVFLIGVFFITLNCKDSSQYTTINPSDSISKKEVSTHKVIVKEFENAGSYTYVKVIEDGKDFWIAIPETKIEIGETYYFDGGTKMMNFKSNELNRTFEKVLFVQALRSHEEKSPRTNGISLIKQPDGGIAIKDLLKNANSLDNKEVIVKGKVVKVNRNILDKNWVHISDGTNFEGKFNLTFTSQDSVNVGDIVTFKGVVTLNKDFGHGYVYPILIEEGQLIE